MITNNENTSQKIAIIGMSCRLPGADNINQFWNNLVNGVESIQTFTDDELRKAGVDDSQINSPNYVKSRGIINGAEYFDAAFFGITPREAEIMDPQHRIFLECAWHALEDGGYIPETTNARIGVFGGTGTNFHLVSTHTNSEVKKYASGTSVVTGNDKDYVATRVSYKLNLTGPSLTVQSACSTSMVAVVTGVNSLLSYQCDMVLAGGSTIELPEKRGYMYQEGGLESSDGHCRTFDKRADGTVFSRGAGVVLLKRYDDAVRDGDNIYAVILAGAINNDGNKKVGFTAPSVEGQASLAIEALELSGISPDTISYVEAHGTATAVGDPIEVTSLSQAFGTYTDKKQFCAIGSVKTNIGHTDSASGVAGLIKTALALKNKKIPAHLHLNEVNPKIDFPNSPFYVNTSLKEWEKGSTPRRAIVNSFGVGGTNACVILEEAPIVKTTENTQQYKTLFLSAKSETALEKTKSNLYAYVQENTVNIDDLAYTYQIGRKAFNNRGILTYKNREDLLQKLAADNSLQKRICEEDNKPVVFMFPGQGNQYLNMGVGLYNENELYKQTVDYCCDFLQQHFKLDLKSFLFAEEGSAKAKEALEQTYITQPAIFVVSYAMAKVVMAKGIKPEAMIGHSVGEYVAACISGILSLDDALFLVAKRGGLIQNLPGGSMLAVLQNEDKILPFLFPGVEIAVVNNPGLCVVAGSDENIATFEAKLTASGFFSKKLSTSHAFHSAMMEPVLAEFAKSFDKITLKAPSIPIVSTVTGNFLTADEAIDTDYWVKHVRQPVRFTDAVLTCLEMNPSVFLEVGPGQSLESAVKRHLDKDSKHTAVRTMRAETEKFEDNEFLAGAFGNLWMVGGTIAWDEFYKNEKRKRISLPVYPFEREAYTIDFSKANVAVVEKTNVRATDTEKWYNVPVWKRSAAIKYLVDNTTDKKSWLIFHDKNNLGNEIVKLLTAEGHTVYEVEAGQQYKAENSNKYTIDISNKEHYEQLLKELTAGEKVINHVIHLVNYSNETTTDWDIKQLEAVEDKTFFSPLYLQQAFYSVNKLKDIHFSVVANGVFDVVGERVYAPEKALSIGTCRVLIQEFPTVRAKFIDVNAVSDSKQQIALAKNIISETWNNSFETVVAYRSNYRWVEGYSPVQLDKSDYTAFKSNGIYLITGGLGGIGILTAKTIAAEVNATFILTYNSPIPAREEWAAWLEENKGKSFTRDKIEGVLELEAMGSKVILYQVNVADYEGMKKMLSTIEKTTGKINGIIHSAGLVGGGIIPLKTAEATRPVFEAKFRGTVVLDKVFAGYDLDFFWLYSSVTSILGESTRLDYCSANAFLDAYSYYRKTNFNDHATAINWGGWIAVGMAGRWEDTKSAKAPKTILRHSKDLLSFVKQEGDTQVYDVKFKPENDWNINSHFIISQPTVVGTTFIELAGKYAELLYPGQTVELKNLYFMSPMMFEKGKDKKVRLFIDLKNDKIKFSFKTQPFDKDSDNDIWHDHFMGEIVPTEKGIESLNLADIKEKLKGQIDDTVGARIVYNAQNQPLIDLGERWDISNTIYVGRNEWLAELKLRPEFYGDVDYFDFHPALTDKATSYALRYMQGATYLPFSYKSVKQYGKLPAEIYSYVTISGDSAGKGDDAVSFDITLTDLKGAVLAEIKGYTMKQVNDLPASSKTAGSDKETAKVTNTDYINPEEGVEVIKRLLHTESPEQLVVYPCDWNFMIEDSIPNAENLAERKEKQKSAAKSYYSRPALSTPYEEPASEMEKTIAQIWQDILGLDKVGRNDTFTELGGNSLLAIQTIANIVDVLEVELSAQVFYDNPTVKGLAEAVVSSIMNLDDIENLEELMASMNMEG